MALDVVKRGAVSGNGQEVNAAGEALTTLTQDVNTAGFVGIAAEVNPASVGAAREIRALDASPDYRLRTGVDSALFSDTFCHTTVNVSRYKVVNTTMTNALSGSRWVLNNGNSVTSGQGTQIQTWAHFRMHLSYPLFVDFEAQLAQVPQANCVI